MYVKQLARDAVDGEKSAQQIEALCKIIAHVYILRIMHFTSGARIGAPSVSNGQFLTVYDGSSGGRCGKASTDQEKCRLRLQDIPRSGH